MKEIKRVILSRTDSLGDVVLSLPVAGAIKKHNSSIKIIFIGRTYSEAIIKTSSFIDEFVDYNKIEKLDKKEQIRFLKSLKADAIIHIFPVKQIAKLAKLAKIPVRIGTSHRLFHLLTCNYKLNYSRKNSDLHEAELNLKLLQALNIKFDYLLNEIPELYGYNNLPELNIKLEELLSKDKKNIILHPKSKGSAREWGLENFSKLIEILPQNEYKIFVTGTQAESELMKDFLQKNHQKLTDLTGRLTLKELVAFIGKADALVAASTGPLHIAAATGIKAIGIYAPMSPIHPGRWKPVGKNADYLVLDKDCDDCRKGGVCKCILEISPFQVAEKIKAC